MFLLKLIKKDIYVFFIYLVSLDPTTITNNINITKMIEWFELLLQHGVW